MKNLVILTLATGLFALSQPIVNQGGTANNPLELVYQAIPTSLTAITTLPVHVSGVWVTNDSTGAPAITVTCNGLNLISPSSNMAPGSSISLPSPYLVSCPTGISIKSSLSGANIAMTLRQP